MYHSSTLLAEKHSIVCITFDLSILLLGFPGGSEVKASACNLGDLGSIPGSGRSPGEGYGNPLQYSCLENPMDRGAWWVTVHGVAKSWTWPSHFTSLHSIVNGRFQFLAICIRSLNIHIQVFTWTIVFISLRQIPTCGIAGSYGKISV